ncbi:MAG: hypothetical protein HQL72_06245 [Magnetococcales bacterium]|nr:hypothetical protein [Magnetococcales bacterium]
MANKQLSSGEKSQSVSLWWRVVTPIQISRIAKCHRLGAFLPTMRLGLEREMDALLGLEGRMGRSGLVARGRSQDRMAVLEVQNQKLNKILDAIMPTESLNSAVSFSTDGTGLTIWMEKPAIEQDDLLELQFSSSSMAQFPVHCYGRVLEVVEENPATHLTRVICQFETASSPALIKKRKSPAEQARRSRPVRPVKQVASPSQVKATMTTLKPAPSVPVKSSASTPSEKKIKGQLLPKITRPVSTRVVKDIPKAMPTSKSDNRPRPANRQPVAPKQPLGSSSKIDEIIQKGLEIVSAEVKASEPAPRVSDDRKDYRVNDRIPFVWSVVNDETFEKECLPFFKTNKEFGLRKRIQDQQYLLKQFQPHFVLLSKKRSKSRKYAIWIQEELSHLFLRAATENEEEYYQGMTALFLGIVESLTTRQGLGQAERRVAQLMLQLKAQMENQRIRDLSNPITEAKKLEKAKENLVNLHPQSAKIIEELERINPNLSKKFRLFKDLVDEVDLTQLDIPAATSPDGKDLFTVNLSATGLAFRTRRLGVKKGDLLEMRIFLSTGGERFQPVNCFGRVVFVQGPLDNKLKIATHIDPMPKQFKLLITTHIARRQREILAEKAALKENLKE